MPAASSLKDLWRMCAEQRDVSGPLPKELMDHGALVLSKPWAKGHRRSIFCLE